MYRDTVRIPGTRAFLPFPAPDELSDSESEILKALERKRRALDDEIARFREQKDREFGDFERELRASHGGRIGGAICTTVPTPSGSRDDSSNRQSRLSSDTSSSALRLFAPNAAKAQANGNITREGETSTGLLSPNSRPVSRPTLSVEKLTINGTTTPPIVGTPPRDPLTKNLSRSPSNLSLFSATPPRHHSRYATTPTERSDELRGLFTPTYLPLLDSRHVPSTSPPEEQKLPAVRNPKRAFTAPALGPSSSSLPSALRTASGNIPKKRKHVTFQLADSAIVQPSSSYEEMPSLANENRPEQSNGNDALMQDMDETRQGKAEEEEQEMKQSSPIPMRRSSATEHKELSNVNGDAGLRGESGSIISTGDGFFSFDEELEDFGGRHRMEPHIVSCPLSCAVRSVLITA